MNIYLACCVVLCCVVLCCTVLCCVVWCCVVLCCVVLYCVVLCCVVLCCVVLCCVVLCCVVWCCVAHVLLCMLCCVVLCCACCVVLCSACCIVHVVLCMLYCVVLCCAFCIVLCCACSVELSCIVIVLCCHWVVLYSVVLRCAVLFCAMQGIDFLIFRLTFSSSRSEISLKFQRRFGYYLMKVYIPSASIVVLSWLAFFMDPTIIADRLALEITMTLTTVFLLDGINDSITHVPYAKASDVFVIVSFGFIFLALLETMLVFRLSTVCKTSPCSCGVSVCITQTVYNRYSYIFWYKKGYFSLGFLFPPVVTLDQKEIILTRPLERTF